MTDFLQDVHERLDLASAKNAFFWLAAASILLIPLDAMRIFMKRSTPLPPNAAVLETADAVLETEAAYLSGFDRNALFGPASGGSSSLLAQASAAELVKDYRLKGIVLGGESEAIVEDARTQKILFVKPGSRLGDLAVKEIKEGFVILSCPGGEARLEMQ